MSAAIDSRRSRVYEAEQLVCRLFDSVEQAQSRTVTWCGSTLTLPIERKFASVESVQAYVDQVLALNWVRAAYPLASLPVTVRVRQGQRFARYEDSVIALPPHFRNKAWALRELCVLHELAHHLARDGHGRQFQAAFIALVEGIVGPEAGFILRTALYENGAST